MSKSKNFLARASKADIQQYLTELLGHTFQALPLEKILNLSSFYQKKVDQEVEKNFSGLEPSLRPYKDKFPTHKNLPSKGVSREDILSDMQSIADLEKKCWQEGKMSGGVYHGEAEHIQFLNTIYALNSQTNPLHSDVWPSINKY